MRRDHSSVTSVGSCGHTGRRRVRGRYARQDAHATQTQLAEHEGPTGNRQHSGAEARSRAAGTGSVIAGGLGVVTALVPRLGFAAITLGLVALAAAFLAGRTDDDRNGRKYARIGVALAIAAFVLGAVNFAIQADAFSYFTTAD